MKKSVKNIYENFLESDQTFDMEAIANNGIENFYTKFMQHLALNVQKLITIKMEM